MWSLCLFSLINETVNDVTVCLLFLQNLTLIILCAGFQCNYYLLDDYVLFSSIIRSFEPKHRTSKRKRTQTHKNYQWKCICAECLFLKHIHLCFLLQSSDGEPDR